MEFNFALQLTLSLGLLVTIGMTENPSPLVETRFGMIQGVTRANYDGQKYDEFLGIPFAEPPIRDLRFQRTHPWNRTWARPYQATSFGASCMQLPGYVSVMSEDCLFLNIYRPNINDSSRSQLLPVLYFIHGSAFKLGSANSYNGSLLAKTGDMIVVTSNYRLGSLGFAYGDGEEMPGNLGVHDAITAFMWIKDNIQSFGGDPNRITLSGQSAGSMISSILTAIPALPANLFHRVFLSSGASISSIFMESKDVSLKKTRLLVEKVGCGSIFSSGEPLTKQHIQCLRKVDPQLLVVEYPEIASLGSISMVPFLPVHGTELVPEQVNELLWKRSNGTQLEIIAGTQQDEASPFYGNANLSSLDDAYKYLFELLSYTKKDLTDDEMAPFFHAYFNDSQTLSPFALKGKAMEFITDYSFGCTTLILSEIYSRRDQVRSFVSSYAFDKFGPELRPFGPQHGDDVFAFFGNPFRDFEGYSDNDRKYSAMLMEIWTKFTNGEQFTDWPLIKLDLESVEIDQTVKNLTSEPSQMAKTKLNICLKWSRLLGYGIPKNLEKSMIK